MLKRTTTQLVTETLCSDVDLKGTTSTVYPLVKKGIHSVEVNLLANKEIYGFRLPRIYLRICPARFVPTLSSIPFGTIGRVLTGRNHLAGKSNARQLRAVAKHSPTFSTELEHKRRRMLIMLLELNAHIFMLFSLTWICLTPSTRSCLLFRGPLHLGQNCTGIR